MSTLGNNDHTTLENDQPYEIIDKHGFGEVMTLVDVDPITLEDYKTYMHMVHQDNDLRDSYIIEFYYDLHVTIMRETNMVIGICMLPNYISLC